MFELVNHTTCTMGNQLELFNFQCFEVNPFQHNNHFRIPHNFENPYVFFTIATKQVTKEILMKNLWIHATFLGSVPLNFGIAYCCIDIECWVLLTVPCKRHMCTTRKGILRLPCWTSSCGRYLMYLRYQSCVIYKAAHVALSLQSYLWINLIHVFNIWCRKCN